MNENTNYEGQGLRGPLWTIAGGTLAKVLGGIHGAFGSGLVGRGCSGEVSALESEIARLKAEKFTDEKDAALRDSLLKNWLKPLADEAAANKVKIATLEADISKNKEIAELQMKLAEERNRTEHAQINGAIGLIDQRLHCVEKKVDAITAIRVPNSAVCPGWGPVTITPTPAEP